MLARAGPAARTTAGHRPQSGSARHLVPWYPGGSRNLGLRSSKTYPSGYHALTIHFWFLRRLPKAEAFLFLLE
jgi:hypothetical protein